MPIPLWIPLLTLLTAVAREEEEPKRPRWGTGEPLNRSVFDVIDDIPMLAGTVGPLSEYLASHPNPTVEATRSWFVSQGLGSMTTPESMGLLILVHGLARARTHRAIWQLDPEAYTALVQTAPPWEFVRNQLPRLPFPAMLIRLPQGASLPIEMKQKAYGETVPDVVSVRSILLIEEIPGQKWRYLGFDDAPKMEQMAYSKGYLDLSFASAKAQLVEGKSIDENFTYSETGDDKIWNLALNLILALDNEHLDGQTVQPRVPKSSRKRAKLSRRKSFDPYTVIRLSQASKTKRAEQGATRQTTPTGRKPHRRHLRPGHWRGQWKLDPEGKPIYNVRPRLSRSGEPLGGNLYQVAIWIFPHWAGQGDEDPGGLYKVKL